MLERIVSGGQTGADQAGWRAAREFGIPTSGWMPLGFLTEKFDGKGSEFHPEFADLYHERELPTPGYPERTRANARDSDATLWFGTIDSRGFRTTHDAALALGRPFLIVYEGVTRPSHVAAWLVENRIGVLNVAGNRESVNPGIGDRVERFLTEVCRRLGHERA